MGRIITVVRASACIVGLAMSPGWAEADGRSTTNVARAQDDHAGHDHGDAAHEHAEHDHGEHAHGGESDVGKALASLSAEDRAAAEKQKT